MQLKNNQTRQVQFYFYRKDGKDSVLDFVHIPAGATVEIADEVFDAICASVTEVAELEEVETVLDDSNIGATITNGKDKYSIKEYYETGRTRKVNLVKEAIKQGHLTIVSRPKVSMELINKKLAELGIPVKDMSDDAKLALYDSVA